jgi:hypothetical protein
VLIIAAAHLAVFRITLTTHSHLGVLGAGTGTPVTTLATCEVTLLTYFTLLVDARFAVLPNWNCLWLISTLLVVADDIKDESEVRPLIKVGAGDPLIEWMRFVEGDWGIFEFPSLMGPMGPKLANDPMFTVMPEGFIKGLGDCEFDWGCKGLGKVFMVPSGRISFSLGVLDECSKVDFEVMRAFLGSGSFATLLIVAIACFMGRGDTGRISGCVRTLARKSPTSSNMHRSIMDCVSPSERFLTLVTRRCSSAEPITMRPDWTLSLSRRSSMSAWRAEGAFCPITNRMGHVMSNRLSSA